MNITSPMPTGFRRNLELMAPPFPRDSDGSAGRAMRKACQAVDDRFWLAMTGGCQDESE
jgi:hypothetical protein